MKFLAITFAPNSEVCTVAMLVLLMMIN